MDLAIKTFFGKDQPLPEEPLALDPDVVDIALPEKIENLAKALFLLHRKIERQYSSLPWPSKMQNIVVLTEVIGGLGDIAAAAKAIALMQKLCPTLAFQWVVVGTYHCDPMTFLNCDDPSKVSLGASSSQSPEKIPGDFLLTGPVKTIWGVNYIESRISRKITGPTLGFLENAEELCSFNLEFLQDKAKTGPEQAAAHEIYQTLHRATFPDITHGGSMLGFLPMGITAGSGVFLDQSRLKSPLSRGYCCPSYLLQIQDVDLRKDILEAMHVFDGQSEPDYDQYSFNSGYAHWPSSWGRFINCVAIHEKTKHVVIVLNQRGEFDDLSVEQFQEKIFTPKQLDFLKAKGYGTVVIKGKDQSTTIVQESEKSPLDRHLTVIVRPSFTPNDMKQMQLASKRLLATGDNTAVESWCARCKLYLYEDVANAGCKWRFLRQQVDLAKTISPKLSKLLALFGEDGRIPNPNYFKHKPFHEQTLSEIEQLLDDPTLGEATLELCHHITTNYSFDEVLEAGLKRTAWHYCIPSLAKIEAETLDEAFRSGLVEYLKNPETPEKAPRVTTLPELRKRVEEIEAAYKAKELAHNAKEKAQE